MPNTKIVIAYNPMSGSFRPSRLNALVRAFEAAGHKVDTIDGYSDELHAIAAKADQLCIYGGDGTVRDVIERLEGAGRIPAISIYPAGTINLLTREALYPRNPAAFVRRVDGSAPVRQHYMGRVNGKPLLVCASIGPDSIAVANISEALKRKIGRFAYVVAFAKLLWRWPNTELTVTVGDAEYRCAAAFVLKGRFFAGPWKISPDANLTHPHFELVLFPRMSRLDYLQLMLSAMLHRQLGGKNWIRVPATDVSIEGDENHAVQVDGDVTTELPARFSIDQKSIEFA
jgi:diacylglycerol kinase (ATP)